MNLLFRLIFSSKIGHAKTKLETTLEPGYFYTACSGISPPFRIFICCVLANGDPLLLHCGIYVKTSVDKTQCK